jgi:hypothetical protein
MWANQAHKLWLSSYKRLFSLQTKIFLLVCMELSGCFIYVSFSSSPFKKAVYMSI